MLPRRSLLLAVVIVALTASPSFAQQHLFSAIFGDDATDQATAVAVGPDGSVVLAGVFSDSITFGGTEILASPNAWSAFFVAKHDDAGSLLWAQVLGTEQGGNITDLAVGGNGSVYVSGNFFGSVFLGSDSLASADAEDGFVVCLDANGAWQWGDRFQGTGVVVPRALAAEDDGSLVVAGDFANELEFGGAFFADPGSGSSLFVGRYAPGGSLDWATNTSGIAGTVGVAGLGLDDKRRSSIVGGFSGTVDFGAGSVSSAGGLGDNDLFVARFDSSGAFSDVLTYGTASGQEFGADIAVEEDGSRFYVTGSFYGTTDLGDGPVAAGGGEDIFFAAYLDNGAPVWIQAFGDSLDQRVFGLARAGDGSLGLVGRFRETVDFGGGPLTTVGAFTDGFLAVFESDGTHRWSRAFQGVSTIDVAEEAAFASDGSIWATGWFGDTVDFGGGPLSSVAASIDAFLVRYGFETVGVGEEPRLRERERLNPVWPNPFRSRSSVRFTLTDPGPVQLTVFDARGRRVATLVNGLLPSGPHERMWNGRDDRGGEASEGVYFLRLATTEGVRTARMVKLP